MTKKLKDFVKQNIAPASKFGTNPTDPWSAKANLSESLLDKYLSSKGINPKYVSKDTKIAYSKSNEFKMWAQNHRFEEYDLQLDESGLAIQSPTKKRLSDLRAKNYSHSEIGVAHHQPVRKEAVAYGNENEEFEEEELEDEELEEVEEESIEELGEALQPVETHPYEVHHKTKGLVGRYKTLKSASRAVDKHDNEHGGVIATYKYVGGKKTTNEAKSDYTLYHPTYSAAIQHARSKLQDKGLDIHDDDWFQHVNSGPRKPSPGDTNSLHIPLQKDGKESKKMAHIQVFNRGYEHGNPYELNMYHEEVQLHEDKYQDASAATQTVGMEVESKKKSLKTFKKMCEDLQNKSGESYGKKPKMIEAKKEDSGVGENKPQAVGVMSGGTTLTGEKRDVVEIDPMMKTGRPNADDDKKINVKKQEAK